MVILSPTIAPATTPRILGIHISLLDHHTRLNEGYCFHLPVQHISPTHAIFSAFLASFPQPLPLASAPLAPLHTPSYGTEFFFSFLVVSFHRSCTASLNCAASEPRLGARRRIGARPGEQAAPPSHSNLRRRCWDDQRIYDTSAKCKPFAGPCHQRQGNRQQGRHCIPSTGHTKSAVLPLPACGHFAGTYVCVGGGQANAVAMGIMCGIH
uniref:Uncharacterized protein n=1 Tax=Oryza glumipatula TaxID=40148 RepID=A0A0E0B8Q7_9ORYZ